MSNRNYDQITFRRPAIGPFASHLSQFAEVLRAQQYAPVTVYCISRHVARFSEWLAEQQIGLDTFSEEQTERYLETKKGIVRTHARNAIGHLSIYLQSEGLPALTCTVQVLSSVDHCVAQYAQYLRVQRNLAGGTIRCYRAVVREFLHYQFGNEAVDFDSLCTEGVISYLRHKAKLLNQVASVQAIAVALRSFLRYVNRQTGKLTETISQVPSVAGWSQQSLPRAMASEQVEKLLDSVDCTTATGKRDYAIILLLARLGLRACEVAFLTLDDIDWSTSTLTVTLKSGRQSRYPLTQQIGDSMVDYLQNARPKSHSRRVFLRVNAPFDGFKTSVGVCSLVSRQIQRAGIDAPTRGSHQLRHAVATTMLSQGASLEQIGNLLSHRDLESTHIYTKVDIDALRGLTLRWPGVS